MRDFVLTSESVTRGHPDKLCDQISDAIVDACLGSDPDGGVVAECAVASGVVFLSVRNRRPLAFDPSALARRVIAEAGYEDAYGPEGPTVMLNAVDDPLLPGPNPKGAACADTMTTAFGYAGGGSDNRLPAPSALAHDITRRIDALALSGAAPWLSPDAKAQVAVRYADRMPQAIEAIAITYAPRDEAPRAGEAEAVLRTEIVDRVLAEAALPPTSDSRFVFRPAPGPGGPRTHAGLTGRKTADDCYGAFARHSSSALSGKDPSRIERVAAYAARQAALSLVAARAAGECEVQLSYAPGDETPLSVEIDTFGSGVDDDERLSRRLRETVDFRVGAIVERLGLWGLPAARDGRFYRDFAAYGHFGRLELDPPWERPLDAVNAA